MLTLDVVTQVLSPTYKQRNEDFRKLFKQLPDTERLIVGELVSWEGPTRKSESSRESAQAASDQRLRANTSRKVELAPGDILSPRS